MQDMEALVGREEAERIASLVWKIALGEGYTFEKRLSLFRTLSTLSPWWCMLRFKELVEEGLRERPDKPPADIPDIEVLSIACRMMSDEHFGGGINIREKSGCISRTNISSQYYHDARDSTLPKRLVEQYELEFDDYMNGHFNTIIGYLGLVVAERYIREFIARKTGLDKSKIFIFSNTSGAPSLKGSSDFNKWRPLERRGHGQGTLEISSQRVRLRTTDNVERPLSGTRYSVRLRTFLDDNNRGEQVGETPVEEYLKHMVEELGDIPSVDIIAIYCPQFERATRHGPVCRSCKFYEVHGRKCPHSRKLDIVLVEVKSTRGTGEYEVLENQIRTLTKLKELGYNTLLAIIRFKGSIKKPIATINLYEL